MDKIRHIVFNRSAGTVGYTIEHEGNKVRRIWAPQQKMPIDQDELFSAMLIPGAARVLTEHLLIDADFPTLCKIFGRDDIVPEYKYTPEEIKRLLMNGSLDELLDCLDFAPAGVVGLLKKYAVDMKLADANKRKAIKDKTGLDLDRVFVNLAPDSEEEEAAAKAAAQGTPQRRVQTPAPAAESNKEVEVETILDI